MRVCAPAPPSHPLCPYRALFVHTASLHRLTQVCRHVIKPATQAKEKSYIELVATAPQLPEWFVSHWYARPAARLYSRSPPATEWD